MKTYILSLLLLVAATQATDVAELRKVRALGGGHRYGGDNGRDHPGLYGQTKPQETVAESVSSESGESSSSSSSSDSSSGSVDSTDSASLDAFSSSLQNSNGGGLSPGEIVALSIAGVLAALVAMHAYCRAKGSGAAPAAVTTATKGAVDDDETTTASEAPSKEDEAV